MTRLLLLTLILFSSFLQAQECYWEPQINRIEYNHKLSDFGLRGKVKSCTRVYETQNEHCVYQILHRAWGDHHFIERFNFNRYGNLTSIYRETNQGDTMEIVLVDYDSLNRISEVHAHSISVWVKYERFNGENWEQASLYYNYQNNKLESIRVLGGFGLPFPGRDVYTLKTEYKNDRLVRKAILRGNSIQDTVHCREYKYSHTTGLLDEEVTTRAIHNKEPVTIKYHYATDGTTLTGKTSIPLEFTEESQEATWTYDKHQNLTHYNTGDTTEGFWYCQKFFAYNKLNDLVWTHTNMEYDGRAKLQKQTIYLYDQYDNWTERYIRESHDIAYGGGTRPDEYFKESQDIEYYE